MNILLRPSKIIRLIGHALLAFTIICIPPPLGLFLFILIRPAPPGLSQDWPGAEIIFLLLFFIELGLATAMGSIALTILLAIKKLTKRNIVWAGVIIGSLLCILGGSNNASLGGREGFRFFAISCGVILYFIGSSLLFWKLWQRGLKNPLWWKA